MFALTCWAITDDTHTSYTLTIAIQYDIGTTVPIASVTILTMYVLYSLLNM